MRLGRRIARAVTGFIVPLFFAGAAAAQGMTAPIDTGRISTQPIQLNRDQPQAPAARPRPAPAAAPAATRNLEIKAFFGSFAGSGLADAEDVSYLGVTQRDLDVRIAPAGEGGFSVAWTTVVRESSSAAPKRKATTMTFVPGPRPSVFRATDNGDPLAGGMVAWARVNRDTLNVYLFSVRDDGRHELQTYARTLSGTGMDLVYTRIVDGERQRRVRGKLVKNAN
jgi:hypothetical protein